MREGKNWHRQCIKHFTPCVIHFSGEPMMKIHDLPGQRAAAHAHNRRSWLQRIQHCSAARALLTVSPLSINQGFYARVCAGARGSSDWPAPTSCVVPAPGSGASGGNGAQLSYSYVQPLADPGIWRQLPKLLLSRSSPLKLRPRLDPRQWLWGLQFLVECNGTRSRASTVWLLKLATSSRQAFDSMMKEENLDCDFSASGKLVLYSGAEAFAGAKRQLMLQRQLGSIQEAVSADRCVEIEPALEKHHRQIAGAIYTPGECAADCQKTCGALLAILRRAGVCFLLGTSIDQLVVAKRSWQRQPRKALLKQTTMCWRWAPSLSTWRTRGAFAFRSIHSKATASRWR